MNKIVRLTEKDLTRLVKRVISESDPHSPWESGNKNIDKANDDFYEFLGGSESDLENLDNTNVEEINGKRCPTISFGMDGKRFVYALIEFDDADNEIYHMI